MSARRIVLLLICIGAVGVRFWKVDSPFTDPWSWRQSDVAAIARNYFEHGFRFAYPEIDWAGPEQGFVGTEFPALPFTAALAYKFLGVHEWIGRVETILFFALSLPFFFFIVRRAFGESAAIFAVFFYSFAPLSIAAGRAFMPDFPSLSCAFGGWYFFQKSLARKNQEHRYLAIAAIMVALALLIKAPMVTIAAPIGALVYARFGRGMFRQPLLWLFAGAALIPSIIWYWHAHLIAERFYPFHFFGAGGIRIMNLGWYWRIALQTFTSTLTPPLFLLAIIGLFSSRASPRVLPWHCWSVAMVCFIVVVGYGNRHQWYQLPLVPIAAAFGGEATSLLAIRLKRPLVACALIALFLVSSFFYARHFFVPAARSLWLLGHALRDRTSEDALIVIADDGDPTALYYAHRRGWHFLERNGLYYGNPVDGREIVRNLEQLRVQGATHLAFYRATMWWLEYYPDFADYLVRTSKLEAATGDYLIYKLNFQTNKP